ncbi:MAG: hypothetical protein KJ621_20240 [Proteobacteria bacterium]|nr:hypothetical protein [Pseudomonadota bacterium]MBU1741950.1 hypothetical protein [Pseudomonadota bacterium]
MRRYRRYSLLLWGVGGLLVAAQVGYLAHFWGWRPLWDVIHWFGHSAGWCGGAAMALSLLYIPRKKKWFTWGKVRTWYQFHVAMGLTGPLLIILHAYGKYYGIGGLTLLCLGIVLATGVVGHFIFRRLGEEVAVRAEERARLEQDLAALEREIEARRAEAAGLLQDLETAGPLGQLARDEKIKLPRARLFKDVRHVGQMWRDFWATSRQVAALKRRVKAQARVERRALALKEMTLKELLLLERDTRNLVALNEIFSLWRKVHVPVSWLMWWLLAMHLFAWTYY